MFYQEKKNEINGWHYQGLYGYDEDGYSRDLSMKEARIELLEELIRKIK